MGGKDGPAGGGAGGGRKSYREASDSEVVALNHFEYSHIFAKFDAFLMNLSPKSIRDRRVSYVIIVKLDEI